MNDKTDKQDNADQVRQWGTRLGIPAAGIVIILAILAYAFPDHFGLGTPEPEPTAITAPVEEPPAPPAEEIEPSAEPAPEPETTTQ